MKAQPKFWKVINNTGNSGAPSSQKVKVVVKINSNASKAVIIEPGNFVIGMAQITTSLDAQNRRRFVTIDEEFDNSVLDLPLGEQYEIGHIDKVQSNTDEYMK